MQNQRKLTITKIQRHNLKKGLPKQRSRANNLFIFIRIYYVTKQQVVSKPKNEQTIFIGNRFL